LYLNEEFSSAQETPLEKLSNVEVITTKFERARQRMRFLSDQFGVAPVSDVDGYVQPLWMTP
jgi:hypothetical protein